MSASSEKSPCVNSILTNMPVGVRGIFIGSGMPKIIVSTKSDCLDELLSEVTRIDEISEIDIIEFRSDKLLNNFNINDITIAVKSIRKLSSKPILFTLRSKEEGGELDPEIDLYYRIYRDVIFSGCVDLIDIEVSKPSSIVKKIIMHARAFSVRIMLSYHNNNATPDEEFIWDVFLLQKRLGADIIKIATTARNNFDIIKIMFLTAKFSKIQVQLVVTLLYGLLTVDYPC